MTFPVLIPLIGLPGAGKTSFARNLMNHVKDSNADDNLPVIFHLQFDEFLPQISSEDDAKTTKRFRKAAVSVIEIILELLVDNSTADPMTAGAFLHNFRGHLDAFDSTFSGNDAAKTIASKLTGNSSDAVIRANTVIVFLLDDNNVYRSMRYEYYQLARKHSVGFLQLIFDCPPSFAKSNDASRDSPHRVGDDVIEKMAMALEGPDPTAYRWERRGCRLRFNEKSGDVSPPTYEVVDGSEVIISCSVRDLVGVIRRILFESQNPVRPTLIESTTDEERETDRRINLQNVLHQCDVKLRSLVGQRMKELKKTGGDAKTEGRRLSVVKAVIFDRVKRGDIELDLDALDSEVEDLFLRELAE